MSKTKFIPAKDLFRLQVQKVQSPVCATDFEDLKDIIDGKNKSFLSLTDLEEEIITQDEFIYYYELIKEKLSLSEVEYVHPCGHRYHPRIGSIDEMKLQDFLETHDMNICGSVGGCKICLILSTSRYVGKTIIIILRNISGFNKLTQKWLGYYYYYHDLICSI